jgi:hypothetical protein
VVAVSLIHLLVASFPAVFDNPSHRAREPAQNENFRDGEMDEEAAGLPRIVPGDNRDAGSLGVWG